MAQWIKDLAVSLQWLGLLLWHGFDPCPRNFHVPRTYPNNKKKTFKNKLISDTNGVQRNATYSENICNKQNIKGLILKIKQNLEFPSGLAVKDLALSLLLLGFNP